MNNDNINLSPQTALNIIIVTESTILILSCLLIYKYHLILKPLFHFNIIQCLIGLALGIMIAIFTKLSVLLNLNSKFILFKELKELYSGPIYDLFKSYDISQIILISFCSGFCEEVLYRGVLQGLIGFWPTNMLFGIMHTPKLTIWPLLLFSTFVGIILSCLKIHYHSIWPSIICHSVNNLISLLLLKFFPLKK